MSTFVPTGRFLRGRDVAFVLLIWAVATAVNLGKAAHIDDGAHLAIAQHILADPWHPMRGIVFWGTHPGPIHALNQPHLFFYLLAGALALSGGSLIVAQLALALTVLPGIAAFHALGARLLGAEPRTKQRLATALVFLGPGFLPGQNLMCDAPLLSLVCVALWALLTAEGERTRSRLVLAGVAVGLACLVKYTAVALLPLFVLDAWLGKDAKRLLPLGIALGFLAAYAGFNVADYGGVHMLQRQMGGVGEFSLLERIGITFARGALFVITLGAIAFVPFLGSTSRRTWIWLGSVFVFVVAATRVVAAVGPPEVRDEPWAVTLLRTAFFLWGVLALLQLSRAVDLQERKDVLLGASIVLITFLVVVLSPFVAVRHALLVLPALTLLVLARAQVTAGRALALAGLSTVIGLVVAVSDRVHAEVYRDAVAYYRSQNIAPGRTWYVGHWGWQYYADEAGLLPYDPGVSVLAPGDRLIRPKLVDGQPLDPRDLAQLEVVDERVAAAGAMALGRTITSRQGYYAVWQGLPYGPSSEPLETFTRYRVK